MGRPPTPTQLKVVRNTQRKDRANAKEPKPPTSHATNRAPAWISSSARPWWRRLRPLLTKMQVLTDADPTALGLLCDALAEYVAARDQLVKSGRTYETVSESGSLMIRAHPAVAIQADAWRRAKLMLTEFGLTPASRAKVTVADAGPADPLEAWEHGRGTGS